MVSLSAVGSCILTNLSLPLRVAIPSWYPSVEVAPVSAASIIANTSKALKAIGGGGGIGGASLQGGGGVSAAPQVQFQGSSENQISNAVNQSQQNIQVTVLEKDISNAQGNVKALVSENSI